MAIATTDGELRTVGEVATLLGRPFYQIAYAIRSRRIEPAGRGGALRLLGPREVERVREALEAIDRRKRQREAAN